MVKKRSIIRVIGILSITLYFYQVIYKKMGNGENFKVLWKRLVQDVNTQNKDMTYIYIITPTYKRPTQKADLTKTLQTISYIPNLIWFVVEDAESISPLVTRLLKDSNISYIHLFEYDDKDKKLLKGIHQRNRALQWIRDHKEYLQRDAVVYFADDDNTYSWKLFEQMRSTNYISVWPVGLIPPKYETPVVKNGKVIGWISWATRARKFPLDMAGFAFHVKILSLYRNLKFLKVPSGYQESTFISQFVTSYNQLEPKANNCSEILVWHTRTCNYLYDIKLSNNLDLNLEM